MTASDGRRNRLMDITGVADRLGVSVRYVRRLVAERRIPYIKFGHLLRFDPKTIDEWLDKARVDEALAGPPSPTPPHNGRFAFQRGGAGELSRGIRDRGAGLRA